MTDQQVYPIEKSAHGTNTHYLHCDHVGRRQSYAVCQHIIAKHKSPEGLAEGQFSDCQKALSCNGCAAVRMMAEEQKAGHALYYEPRRIHAEPIEAKSDFTYAAPVNKASESYQRGRYGAPAKAETAPAPRKKPAIQTQSMADAVNAISDTPAPPAKNPAPTGAKPPRERGESPVAYMKRLKELGY